MTIDRKLNTALKCGEQNADVAIRCALELCDLRRAVSRAIHQLKIGKTAAALRTLEGGITNDHRRKIGATR